jgi:hypothetical protein
MAALLRQSYDGPGDSGGLMTWIRPGDYDDSMMRAAFMKVELCERQEIVSIARDDTALLARSLIEHLLIFCSREINLSDVNSVDTFGSQD